MKTPARSRSARSARGGCISAEKRYPNATTLLITADGGGSNSSRTRLWRTELQKLALRGMIGGDDTRTRVFFPRPPNRVTRIPPRRSLDPGMTGAHARQRRNEKGMEQAVPRHATTPSTREATPTPPNDALWAESRHDRPDAPARRRGHPWPLGHASAVPTIAGHRAQRADHNPSSRGARTSPLRSDDQKPCSGRNLDPRNGSPIIHGGPRSSATSDRSRSASATSPPEPRNGTNRAPPAWILH